MAKAKARQIFLEKFNNSKAVNFGAGTILPLQTALEQLDGYAGANNSIVFLAGQPVITNLNGYKIAGTAIINPSLYIYSQATIEYVAYSTAEATTAILRLWNTTTSTQIGTTKSTTSTAPVKLTQTVTLTAGENIYEVQISAEPAGTNVVCCSAKIILT